MHINFLSKNKDTKSSGRSNHLGLTQSSAKNTACDRLRNRTDKVIDEVYFSLADVYDKNFPPDVGQLVFDWV